MSMSPNMADYACTVHVVSLVSCLSLFSDVCLTCDVSLIKKIPRLGLIKFNSH